MFLEFLYVLQFYVAVKYFFCKLAQCYYTKKLTTFDGFN